MGSVRPLRTHGSPRRTGREHYCGSGNLLDRRLKPGQKSAKSSLEEAVNPESAKDSVRYLEKGDSEIELWPFARWPLDQIYLRTMSWSPEWVQRSRWVERMTSRATMR